MASPQVPTGPVPAAEQPPAGQHVGHGRTLAPASCRQNRYGPVGFPPLPSRAGGGTLGAMEQDGPPPERVRVVLAGGARPPRPDAAAREIEEQTPVGEVLVRGLIRTQLALAVRLSLLVCALFGAQPVLFALFPRAARTEVFGLPLP